MIKAVIFDCFGVLVRGSLEPFIEKHFGTDPENQEAMRHLDHLASRGVLTEAEYLEKVAEITGLTAEQVDAELDQNPANKPLFTYIRDELKPKYKIGFLSNAYDNWLNHLFTPEQQQLFDSVVLSYDVHMAKPDPRIYHLAADKLGLEPQECIFVDDIAEYCDAAREVGMHAVHYQNLDQCTREIQTILGS